MISKPFKSLKNYETLNLARPSKKSVLSPQATTWIDANEVLDKLLDHLIENEEDLGEDIIDQLTANREAVIQIMHDCIDAELAYDYLNCEIGRGILIGIIITVLGNVIAKRMQELEEEGEDMETEDGP